MGFLDRFFKHPSWGVHPDDHKRPAADAPLRFLPTPARVYMPLSQHVGGAARPVVLVGRDGSSSGSARPRWCSTRRIAASGRARRSRAPFLSRSTPMQRGRLAPRRRATIPSPAHGKLRRGAVDSAHTILLYEE